jgi:hypothetical protein
MIETEFLVTPGVALLLLPEEVESAVELLKTRPFPVVLKQIQSIHSGQITGTEEPLGFIAVSTPEKTVVTLLLEEEREFFMSKVNNLHAGN